MVKRLTLLLCLLAGGAGATVVTTAGSGNMSALSFTANDTLIVANGHTLTVDTAYSTTAPVIRMVFVRSGGTLTWTGGKGFGCNALVQGNRASAPFSSTNGGRVVGASTGYLHTYHDAAFTYDWEVGAGADVIINVNAGANGVNAFVVNGKTSACRFYALATADSIQISGARFSQFYNTSLANGGVQINASGRTGFTQVRRSYFDTSNFTYVSATSLTIDTCYFWTSTTVARVIHLWTGGSCGIYGNTINVDANGGAQAATGIYAYNHNSAIIRANYIRDYNSTVFGNTYGILLDGTSSNVSIRCDTLIGFGFTIGTAVGSANRAITIDSCWIYGNDDTHELIIKHDNDRAWRVACNQMYFHSGGGRSAVLNYCSSTPSDSGDYFYNTINAAYGGGAASSALAWEHTASGSLTYLGDRVVGNVLIGNNASFGYAEMIVGTTASQTATVTFREFKYNAYDSVYLTSGSSVNYPYTYSDSNKNNATAFAFVDSLNGDFRLSATSPMLNCGDSIFGVNAFGTGQASKAPFDIGYYQSYTTGTCGGGSPTPTGACCYNYTCAVMTEAQCTSLSGTYQGDGTSTCSNCTAPQPTGRLFNHAKFAAITYSGSTQTAANGTWLGRHQDLTINPTSTLYTAAIAANANHKYINYLTLSTLRGSDTTDLRTYSTSKGWSADTLIIRANGSLSMEPPQAAGAPCVAGACTTTVINGRIVVCQWTTWRNYPDWNKSGAWYFTINKAVTNSGNYGILEDEAQHNFQQGNLGAAWTDSVSAPENSGVSWPDEGSWCTGSPSDAIGWSAYSTSTLRRLRMLSLHATYIPQLVDSMNAHNYKIFSNGAAYQWGRGELIQDLQRYGRSVLYGEGMSIGVIYNNYKATSWEFMDSVGSWGPTKDGEAAIATYIGDNATNAALPEATTAEKLIRQNFHNYCWYMMAANDYTYFYTHGNNSGTTPPMMANDWLIADSLYKWQNVMAIDLGAATGTRSVVVAGTYPVYRRNFQKGSILYRPGAAGADMSSGSAVSVSLGRTMYRVDVVPDTTKQAGSTTTSIRIGDGAVLVDSTYFLNPTGSITVGDATVTEGGTMTFTVTLSAAQSVLTTFNYSTANGTALSGTDYTATSGSKSIPIGSTSTTITVPTTDRSGCQASRAFTVSITGVSPATLTIIDPTGTGTITDDDCGVTIGKTYKGKIAIKGKVKP